MRRLFTKLCRFIAHHYAWYVTNKKAGQLLGYPKCCVDAFVKANPHTVHLRDQSPGDLLRLGAAYYRGKYTGFIPCLECAVKVVNEEVDLAALVDNDIRQKNGIAPFPDEWSEKYCSPRFNYMRIAEDGSLTDDL